MTVEMYDMEIREIAHDTINGKEWIIINQSFWYPADRYTEETAIETWYKWRNR